MESFRSGLSLYPEWEVVTGFYFIVHCGEAVLAREGKHAPTHGARDAALAELAALPDYIWLVPLLAKLIRLKVLANWARYGPRDGQEMLDWSAGQPYMTEFSGIFQLLSSAFITNVPDLQ